MFNVHLQQLLQLYFNPFHILDSNCQEFICDIIHVEKLSSIFWKIPQFPVVTLEFSFVQFRKDGRICVGVIDKCKVVYIQPGTYTCTSHCEITISGSTYTVFWKLMSTPLVSNVQEDKNDVMESTTNEPVHNTYHSLPFKVLGTCHSTERQKALEDAYIYLEEHNRPVFAKLVAEPENVYDKNAIAVYVKSSSNYEKVGYIAKELTQYVHPVLSDKSHDVLVEKIRFCTTFRMIGFYLTITITKKGLWDNKVVCASKMVK